MLGTLESLSCHALNMLESLIELQCTGHIGVSELSCAGHVRVCD